MVHVSPLSEFEIVTLKTGIKSLRSIARGETFHPVTGPLVEANILHVQQQRLVERSQAAKKFIIWDVGFGAAANVLAAIDALWNSSTEIEIHSFDRTTAPIEFALLHAEELGYLLKHQERLRQLLTSHKVSVTSSLSWELHLGDFRDQIQSMPLPTPNAVLYDPYSPAVNPDMWNIGHFKALRSCLNPNVPCLLTNYTRSTAVRVTLLLAGFYVGQGTEVGEKAETTLATNCKEMLERPLDKRWLERVRVSTNAAPISSILYSKSKISEENYQQLRALPQFQ